MHAPWQCSLRCLSLLLVVAPSASLTLLDPAQPPAPGNLSTVHVAYSSDASGFTGMLASMLSLSRRLKEPEQCVIHLIVAKDDLPNAEQLAECFRNELKGKIAAVPKVALHELQPVRYPFWNIIKRLNTCKDQAISRIYLHKYLPDVDRVLYLDFDTIVKEDVALLYRRPMQHAFAAVVQEKETPKHLYSKKFPMLLNFFRSSQSPTLNSGVLLMDLRRWSSDKVTEALEGWMEKTQVIEDQFLLNLEFQPAGRSFDRLDETWNTYNLGCGALWSTRRLSEAKILHWSCMWKPWTKKYGDHANYRNYWEAPQKCPVAQKYLHVSW